ncbi:IS1634 family transposase [Mycobacterium shinjukuense]|uniref:Transposase n=1 Tax=Mycobacterium shinjukuense TaxID=398694 RepID=A0A7I7MPY6_9MYCO|nr:IS1634 family transposase [Mycobacterium shinjukuense]MCV6984303.1 IS1634 family transposase [Mycobacterium shinjukuense]ORB63762.1 IS4 family transposase [Mycobacterium shinjukuense]BBX74265.1 transposase [Mycobacterium shinjukuense]
MYVARVPNRGSPPAILLRESYRENGKVKNRTLANLSRWPADKIDALAAVLKGLPPNMDLAQAFDITRSLPHGHVAAVLGTAARLGMAELIDPTPCRNRDLVMAMLVAQIIDPDSKLGIACGLRTETATSSLGQVLSVEACDEDDLYAAMDWVLTRKEDIENRLAARHLTNGTLVLYDVSSAAFEGRTCELAKIGHARDGVKGRLQIVYGLLCSTAGAPVAIEVFEGNTGDPKTLATQITKIKDRFNLGRVVLVGDRGMLTSARIDKEVRPAALDWITALRAPAIKALVEAEALQLTLFDQHDLLQITHPDYPGERLVCCRNPVLAEQRTRKRNDLLSATEKQLEAIAAATRRARRPLRGKDKIALRVGTVRNKFKMAKHFDLQITDESFSYTRKTDQIAAEAALDGIYVLRTNLPEDSLADDDVVLRYKGLEDVERFFRAMNSELDVRPIRRRLANRVRAHMLLRMLSYYISWHMKQALAPILFADHDKPAAAAKRANPVAATERSDAALSKAARKRTRDDYPVHSFTTLLADLATICANQIQPTQDLPAFTKITNPTAVQRRAFELLDVSYRLGYT